MKQSITKHRKVLALIAVVAMIAGCPAASFAAGGFDGSTAQTDRDIMGDAPITLNATDNDATGILIDSAAGGGFKGKPIPVYGYVGDDAVITDPNEEDPDEPPVIEAVDINVSVPVKILWAAFEGGSVSPQGDPKEVVSPEYYIKNNSKTQTLKVTVQDFDATGSDEQANNENYIDRYLTLNLTGIGSSFTQNGLVTGNGSAATYLPAPGTEHTGFAPGSTWKFGITGSLGSGFTFESISVAQLPKYSLQLKFDVPVV